MLTICSNEVSIIMRKSKRSAERLLARIRHHNGKHKNHDVTLKEFCDYKGFVVEEVIEELRQWRVKKFF